MKFKRSLVLLLAVVFCVSLLFTGCSSKGKNEAPSGGSSAPVSSAPAPQSSSNGNIKLAGGVEMTPPGTFPIVTNKLTLKFFAPNNPNIKDLYTNEFTKFYEDKTNVHIEWELAPQQAITEKRSLLLASGDYPDVLFGAGITREEEMIYGPQGVFIPLNDLIEKYGPETQKMFSQATYVKPGMTTPDGKMYTLAQVNECYHCTMSQKMWMNTKWLKTLGLEVPKTTDEFYKALKAFKEKDPNGNGKADEIPLSGDTTGWHTNPLDFIMCAFIMSDGDNRLIMKGGKVDSAVNKPEFREGLRYLNKLYKENLIDPGTFTQDNTKLKGLVGNAGVALVGAAPAGAANGLMSATDPRNKEYDAIAPLKGPSGVQTEGFYPYTYTSGTFAITKACKYPEVAMRWADWLYTDEAAVRYIECGVEGQDWRKANPGEKDLNGNQAKRFRLESKYVYGEAQNTHYYQMGPSYRSRDYRESWVGLPDIYDSNNQEMRWHVETKTKMEPYKPKMEEIFPPVYFTKDAVDELAQIKTAIKDYTKESMARFVTGDLDIEKDWDTYVKNLDQQGMKRYIEVQQKAYDAQYKK